MELLRRMFFIIGRNFLKNLWDFSHYFTYILLLIIAKRKSLPLNREKHVQINYLNGKNKTNC